MRTLSIRVEREAGTGEYIVTRYMRHGWSVLFRGDKDAAHDYARGIADDAAWAAANRD